MLENIVPTIPGWAVRAGLPEPIDGESFREYAKRLGYDADELLADLEDRTAVLANYRLAHRISLDLPEAYHGYLDAYCSKRITPERRAELVRMAENLNMRPHRRRNGR